MSSDESLLEPRRAPARRRYQSRTASMHRSVQTFAVAILIAAGGGVSPAAAHSAPADDEACTAVDFHAIGRNPTRSELRCRYGITGPGRFGLLSYADVPVYQPATPMPGTHLVGIPGQARPQPYESFEEWEWRVLGMTFGPDVHRVRRELDLLHPEVAERIVRFESRLAAEGVHAIRRETWRTPQRQTYLFQQGRSRPGPLATTTLTSWHSQMDEQGFPSGRAVDYDVPASGMRRFHEIAAEVGLLSYGFDSNDPGHVFLPKLDALPRAEIALLRTIPRVPEVTLATGRPLDRPLPPGGREALRSTSFAFAAAPFTPYPLAGIAAPPPGWVTAGPRLEIREFRLAAMMDTAVHADNAAR